MLIFNCFFVYDIMLYNEVNFYVNLNFKLYCVSYSPIRRYLKSFIKRYTSNVVVILVCILLVPYYQLF